MAKAYTVFMDEELNKKYHFFLDHPVSYLSVVLRFFPGVFWTWCFRDGQLCCTCFCWARATKVDFMLKYEYASDVCALRRTLLYFVATGDHNCLYIM